MKVLLLKQNLTMCYLQTPSSCAGFLVYTIEGYPISREVVDPIDKDYADINISNLNLDIAYANGKLYFVAGQKDDNRMLVVLRKSTFTERAVLEGNVKFIEKGKNDPKSELLMVEGDCSIYWGKTVLGDSNTNLEWTAVCRNKEFSVYPTEESAYIGLI